MRAFTLIELLVVIAIIAVVAAMTLTSVRLMIDAGRAVKCQSNLRQLMVGIHGYAHDWEGRIVSHNNGSGKWFLMLAPYVEVKDDNWYAGIQGQSNSVIWGCPIWNKDMKVQSMAGDSWRTGYGLAYTHNLPEPTAFHTNWADPGARDGFIAELTHHSARIITGDTCDWYINAGMSGTVPKWDPWWFTPNDWYAAFARSHPIRHRGRANYGFVDGHVSRLGPTGTAWGYLDPSRMSE